MDRWRDSGARAGGSRSYAQVKPRSAAEEFIVKIARAVEEVMQRELVPLPQGTSIIPSEYAIFLSDEDDKEWQGIKRKGLEQGLYHILAERAKEIAGKRKLETRSFVIELRVDGTLSKGECGCSTAGRNHRVTKPGCLHGRTRSRRSSLNRPWTSRALSQSIHIALRRSSHRISSTITQ